MIRERIIRSIEIISGIIIGGFTLHLITKPRPPKPPSNYMIRHLYSVLY